MSSRPFVMPDLLAVKPVDDTEAVVQSLVALGADRERIQMIPVGIFRRYRGVLLGFFPEAGDEVPVDRPIRLYLAEHMLADRIPEGFLRPMPEEGRPEAVFDTTMGGIAHHDEEEVPDGAPGRSYDPEEIARRQLDGGRQLLRFLDMVFRRVRRDIHVRNHSLAFLTRSDAYARRLLALLRLEALAGDAPGQTGFIAASLAGLIDAQGNAGEAGAFLGLLFGVPVRVEEEPSPPYAVPRELQLRLGGGNARLGNTAVPGRELRETRPAMVLRVGPLTQSEAERRLRDTAARDAFERAASALVPAGRPFRVSYDVVETQRAARLGARAGGLLGRSTVLRPRAVA